MASCKDCVHVDVCEDITRHKLSPSRAEKILPILRERGKTCELFKNRSRFVELPCKVGDTVYFIKGGRVMSDTVIRFVIDRYAVKLTKSNGTDIGYTTQFGERIFLTRKEAEQALKERES